MIDSAKDAEIQAMTKAFVDNKPSQKKYLMEQISVSWRIGALYSHLNNWFYGADGKLMRPWTAVPNQIMQRAPRSGSLCQDTPHANDLTLNGCQRNTA